MQTLENDLGMVFVFRPDVRNRSVGVDGGAGGRKEEEASVSSSRRGEEGKRLGVRARVEGERRTLM